MSADREPTYDEILDAWQRDPALKVLGVANTGVFIRLRAKREAGTLEGLEGYTLDRLQSYYDEHASALAALPPGWTEASRGGLATNPDPENGGIIDRVMLTGEWFVIFHREGIEPVEDLPSREEAFRVFEERMKAADEPGARAPGL